MCMSFVAVGRSLTIVSYVAFKMTALWFWTMFNCNPPIAHCHPLLWGRGILVDHWSTISSSEYSDHQAPNNKIMRFFYTPPLQRSWKGGILVSPCPSVRLSVCLSVCPSVDRIVSALYLQQYSLDPFHVCTSYQATSEGVSLVMPVSKFKNLKFWRIL